MSLWTNSANVINETGVDTIIKTIKAFDGYWSKDDLKKFLNIVQTLQNRKNINPNSELSRKLNVLRGEFRGQLPNNGSPSITRGGAAYSRPNQNRTNAMNTNNRTPILASSRTKLSNFMNNLNRLTENNKKKYLNQLNTSGSNFNKIKNAAYDTHRIRVFRTQLGNNIKALSTNQLANYERQIRNDRSQGVLQRVYTNAKRAAQRSRP